MTYQVIARKWRPQQFEDVVGQKIITQTLQNAIRQGRIASAYLFSGTRGVGKTSTARILAKALNCHEGPTPHPCDRCPSCIEIINGSSVDVLEIDAASNRGIGEIRELRENAQYTPSRDRYKIFIIDEVHMLTTEAFNALLKTLEEPPRHVVFILATTELYKIPQTILSRCQQFDFRLIPLFEIKERLEKILKAEGFTLSQTTIEYIVKASGGSMRDAESALQKIISFGGSDISDEDVAVLLGVVKQDILNQMLMAVLSNNREHVLKIIAQLYNQGHDLQNFLRSFIELVRNILVLKISGDEEIKKTISNEDLIFLKEQSEKIQVEDLIRFYEILVKSDNELKWTPFVRYHVETTFLKLASLTNLASLEEIITVLMEGTQSLPQPTYMEPVKDKLPSSTTPSNKPEFEASGNLAVFLKALAKKYPNMKGLAKQVNWQLKGDEIIVTTIEGSIYQQIFNRPSTHDSLKKTYFSLFKKEPKITLKLRPDNERDKKENLKKQTISEQKKIESLFLDDPIASTLIRNIAGKWEFKKED